MNTQTIQPSKVLKRVRSSKKKLFYQYRNLITILVIQIFTSYPSAAQIIDSTKMASPEIKTFQSKILGENRTIFIQTPSKMKSTDQYPVLYLLDGESFVNMAAGQIQYLSESYKVIPSMIIVGIKSNDRFKDLTPTFSITGNDGKPDTSVRSPLRTSGAADKLLQFMQEELFPYIEKNYPTAPYRILFGHSLGGLTALHALVNQPGLFNAYIAISPSLQWDEQFLLKSAKRKWSNNMELKKIVFVSDGNEGADFHQYQLSFDSLVKQKNFQGLNFRYSHYPEESHITEPVKAFYDGIRHIYPDWHLPYNTSAFRKTMTSAIIIDRYNQLSSTYHYHVLPAQDEINAISRFLANDPARIKDALELLHMNARNYPQSAIIYEIMGDTYMKMKDTKSAARSYQNALAIDPQSESVKQKLKNIKE